MQGSYKKPIQEEKEPGILPRHEFCNQKLSKTNTASLTCSFQGWGRDKEGRKKRKKKKKEKIGSGPNQLPTRCLRSRTEAAVSTSEASDSGPVFLVIPVGAGQQTHPWKSNSRAGHFLPGLLFPDPTFFCAQPGCLQPFPWSP